MAEEPVLRTPRLRRALDARALALGFLAWALAFWMALRLGVAPESDSEVITRLRLPRAVLATAVGMGLSVAGATLQALFSNPLCEPYTMGVSSGAALGAVVGASLGLQWAMSGLAGSAFVGALAFGGVLYLVALRKGGSGGLAMLLSGVMLGFLGSSLVALWMAISDVNGIQGALFWLLGDLSRARMEGSLFSLAGVLLLSILIWRRSRELDALLMGEEGALSLGVPVSGLRRAMVILSSLLVGLCVSASGMIGFVGLVVPHFARRMVGALHLRLIPVAAIWGAATLTAADAIGRFIARPYEIPVGVVTALAGAPLFLWVVVRRSGGAAQ